MIVNSNKGYVGIWRLEKQKGEEVEEGIEREREGGARPTNSDLLGLDVELVGAPGTGCPFAPDMLSMDGREKSE